MNQFDNNKQAAFQTVPLPTITQTLKSLDYGEVGRQSLGEAIAGRLREAQRRSAEAAKLERLGMLLDKHPDLPEILGLIRDLGLM